MNLMGLEVIEDEYLDQHEDDKGVVELWQVWVRQPDAKRELAELEEEHNDLQFAYQQLSSKYETLLKLVNEFASSVLADELERLGR